MPGEEHSGQGVAGERAGCTERTAQEHKHAVKHIGRL